MPRGSLLRLAPESAAALLFAALMTTSPTAAAPAAAPSPATTAATTPTPRQTPVPIPSATATPVSSPIQTTSPPAGRGPRPSGLPVAPSPAAPIAGGTGTAVSCGSGGLRLDPPDSLSLGELALSGRDTGATTTVELTVTDMTGSGRGWSLVATSTPFMDARGHRLPAAPVVLAAFASSLPGGCSAPHNSLNYPLTIPEGSSPVTIFSASPGTGTGPSRVVLTVRQDIPASAYRGDYTATWTFSISSEP